MDDVRTYDDAQGMIQGIFDANWKLDLILGYLFDQDDGEEEEPDNA